MKLEEKNWPSKPNFENTESDVLVSATAVVQNPSNNDFLTELFTKFSDFAKLKRVVAYVLRVEQFAKRAKMGSESREPFSSFLTANELSAAERVIWVAVQKQSFHREHL